MFRMQVNVNEEMLQKIDFYCQKLSVGRSALSSMLIGQGLVGLDKAFGLLDGVADEFKKTLDEQLINEFKKDE